MAFLTHILIDIPIRQIHQTRHCRSISSGLGPIAPKLRYDVPVYAYPVLLLQVKLHTHLPWVTNMGLGYL